MPPTTAPTRDIATGITATALIFAIILMLPIVGFFCSLFLPLPVLFYRIKLGRKPAGTIAAASAALMAGLIGGIAVDLIFFLELLLVGFLLGELYDRRLAVESTVGFCAGTALAAAGAGLLLFSVAVGKGPLFLVSEYVGRNLTLTLDMYRQMGMPTESIDRIEAASDQIRFVLVRILPSLAAAAALLISWSSILLSRPLLRARALPDPDFGPLNRWQAPEQLVWMAIGCGAMLLVPIGTLKIIGMNGAIVLMTIYFFQGIAIVSFFFEKKRFPAPLRFILYGLIAIQQVLLLLIIGCGFFDTWFNFRKLETNRSA